MNKYKCKLCSETFEVKDGEEPVCPVCGAKGESLELVADKAEAKAEASANKYFIKLREGLSEESP